LPALAPLEITQDAESLADDISVYLVPEDPDKEGETASLEWFYAEVFETELEGWTTDDSAWPKNRTLEMFLLWFDVQGESLVVDIGIGDIETEDM
jgi:hypothetical protein